MGLIDSGSKSSRLLASRRYTHNTLTSAQEAFTNVLDLQASEIYTQASKIPSASLSFSGSSQLDSNYTDSGDNILKYWYRQKLTKSNVNNEVWFLLDPTGSDSGVGAQLINDNQEVNFVSPKYSVASLATSTTEDTTPGYLAAVFLSSTVSQSAQTSSLSSDDIVSTNDYQFDYKTGIVQFMSANVDPTDSQYVFMTVNQYVGKTLATGVEVTGDVSSSFSSTGSFGHVTIAEMSVPSVSAVSSSVSSRTTTLEGTGTIQGVGTTDDVTFADVTATGTVTAQEYHTEVISSSIVYTSGSTKFGDTADDRHEFTGSLYASSSITADTFSGTFSGALSSSAQIADDISGSFTAASSSFSTRVTRNETTGSNLTTDSGSFSTRVTRNETTGSNLVTDSGSFSTRVTLTGATSSNLVTDSGSFSTRVALTEATASDLISGEIEVVSGSFTSTGSFGRLEIGGDSNLLGNLTIGGHITIGDADTDSIAITAELSSSLIPNADITYDLGTASKRYQFGYLESISTTNITASANLDVDGTANIQGNTTLQADLSVVNIDASGHITGSGNISGSFNTTGSFGRVEALAFAGDGADLDNVVDASSIAMAIVFGG